MIITDIVEQKRNKERYNVYVDGAFSFAASKECIIKNDLHLQTEVTKDMIEKILYEDEYRTALDYAFKRLAYKQFSKNELFKILENKGYDERTINNVLEKLAEYNYINDNELSRMIVSDLTRINKLGKKAIYSKMIGKKINNETAKAALENITPEMEAENAFDILKKYAEKYNYDGENIKVKQKIYRLLINKGYSWDTINDVFSKYEDDLIEE